MSLDDEGAEELNAGDIATTLQQRMVQVLVAAGHATCAYLPKARYMPESGAVVCGCGQFEPWSDDPDIPPWSSLDGDYADAVEADQLWRDADAADRAVRQAGEQRGATAVEAADPIRSTLALIDPTEVYGPEDVERHILDTLWRLETGALFERETVVAAWQASQAYEVKYNALLAVAEGGAADQRQARVKNECRAEFEAMCEAKMMKEAVKQTMHNLRAVLSGYQSTARSVGSAYQAGGSQGGPPQRDGRPW